MENSNGTEMDYKEVCKELDVITNKYFETLEALLETRSQFSDQLKDGFFMMSKARYSMGAKSVGALQYSDNDMTARYVVNTTDEEDEEISYEIVNIQNLGKSSVIVENIGAKDSELRKRTVNKKGKTEDEGDKSEVPDLKNLSVNDNDSNSAPVSEGPLWKDPIKWFGVLVPQSLRQSQKNFQLATEKCGEIVNLQRKLLTLKDEFHILAARKKLLSRGTVED